MPDRERLIEILKLGSCPSPYLCDENCKYANLERCYEERTADLLLEHGVIVPPCKVGDKVYRPSDCLGKECIFYYKANNTCQSKKCAGVNDGRITWIDRLFCKPCIDGVIKDESEGDTE